MTHASKTLLSGGMLMLSAAIHTPANAQIPEGSGSGSKPVIDSIACEQWESVGAANVSDDGNYVLYTAGGKWNPANAGITLYVRDMHSSWHTEIPRGQPIWPHTFTPDNRHLLVTKPGDTLAIVALGDSSAPEIISQVASYKEPANGTGEWLGYLQKTSDHPLTLRNLRTGAQRSFSGANDFWFNNGGTVLIVQTGPMADSAKKQSTSSTLQWISLGESGEPITIWQGRNVDNITFDSSGTRLVFTVPADSQASSRAIWVYQAGEAHSALLTDAAMTGIDSGLTIASIDKFSDDGTRLFISLGPVASTLPAPTGVAVDVWSYTDGLLQSQQLANVNHKGFGEPPSTYKAVIDLQSHHVVRLEQAHERSDDPRGDVVLVHHAGGDADNDEWNWNRLLLTSVYVESTRDGSRKTVFTDRRGVYPSLSPDGRFVVYYDPAQKHFMSYEVASGITRKITAAIQTDWTDYENDNPDAVIAVPPPAGWIKGGWVLIKDQNDIWQVDLTAKRAPINVTNGYGRLHHVVFSLTTSPWDALQSNPNDQLLLTAFDRETKDAGFFRVTLGGSGDPELLTMGPYRYELGQKATHADAYLVRRQSAAESENDFYTTDFKEMTPVTDVHPERNYNWLTTELESWHTPDGRVTQGVLYKPENFDSTKKYPVVLYYYERLSDDLHAYKRPGWADGVMNIPYMVSRGYLVFTPDIHYTIGDPMESAASDIASAGQFLTTLPFVDAAHMGIQGHSFGGYETNFVITKTSIFAAAASGSGGSDMFSDYGSLWGFGASKEGIIENRQSRMGAPPWVDPQSYIDNSAVFGVTHVTTPLLMMNDKNDGAVSFSQGLEYFLALRRLGKCVWMLQYDGEDHVIMQDRAQQDYTVRLLQFFDHYLRGAPAPKWMIEGIPAKMKGIDNGYSLEKPGVEPGPGLMAP